MTHVARLYMLVMTLVGVASVADSGQALPLRLDELTFSELDPRTEARLAQWNSHLGRLRQHMAVESRRAGFGGLAGGASQGVVFRLKLQAGVMPEVVTASVERGIEVYERSIDVIRWPWNDDEAELLSVEQQIAHLLSRRLAMRSRGTVSPVPDRRKPDQHIAVPDDVTPP